MYANVFRQIISVANAEFLSGGSFFFQHIFNIKRVNLYSTDLHILNFLIQPFV